MVAPDIKTNNIGRGQPLTSKNVCLLQVQGTTNRRFARSRAETCSFGEREEKSIISSSGVISRRNRRSELLENQEKKARDSRWRHIA